MVYHSTSTDVIPRRNCGWRFGPGGNPDTYDRDGGDAKITCAARCTAFAAGLSEACTATRAGGASASRPPRQASVSRGGRRPRSHSTHPLCYPCPSGDTMAAVVIIRVCRSSSSASIALFVLHPHHHGGNPASPHHSFCLGCAS